MIDKSQKLSFELYRKEKSEVSYHYATRDYRFDISFGSIIADGISAGMVCQYGYDTLDNCRYFFL